MKLNGNAIRPGNVIEHKARLWVAVKTSHVKPGKGGAFAQVELRDIRDGTKLNERFRATESVERVILDEVSCTYLYAEDTNHIFMHGETFEQFSISEDMIGEQATFLQDGMSAKLGFDTPLGLIITSSIMSVCIWASSVLIPSD